MPKFTSPDSDSLLEVNHCHGPGKGHPCGPGERAPSTTGADTALMHGAKDIAADLAAGGERAASAKKLLSLYPADSPMHRFVAELKPKPSLGERLAKRAAGMRRQRLASGGVAAEKQRKKDYAMARGRATQKLVRAIRQRDEGGGPTVYDRKTKRVQGQRLRKKGY